jgi:hypothetical protein
LPIISHDQNFQALIHFNSFMTLKRIPIALIFIGNMGIHKISTFNFKIRVVQWKCGGPHKSDSLILGTNDNYFVFKSEYNKLRRDR